MYQIWLIIIACLYFCTLWIDIQDTSMQQSFFSTVGFILCEYMCIIMLVSAARFIVIRFGVSVNSTRLVSHAMKMSWYGKAFLIIGPLWGESSVDYPHIGPVMWGFDVFFVVSLDTLPNNSSSWRWFQTPWPSCDVTVTHTRTSMGL